MLKLDIWTSSIIISQLLIAMSSTIIKFSVMLDDNNCGGNDSRPR